MLITPRAATVLTKTPWLILLTGAPHPDILKEVTVYPVAESDPDFEPGALVLQRTRRVLPDVVVPTTEDEISIVEEILRRALPDIDEVEIAACATQIGLVQSEKSPGRLLTLTEIQELVGIMRTAAVLPCACSG